MLVLQCITLTMSRPSAVSQLCCMRLALHVNSISRIASSKRSSRSGQGAAIGQVQQTLRSLQGPESKASRPAHNRMVLAGGATSRPTTSAALAVELASLLSVDLMVAQEPPDILHVNIAQRSRANPSGASLFQQLQYPVVWGLRIDWLLAGPQLVRPPFKTMIGCRQRLTTRGWTPTYLAIDRVLRLSPRTEPYAPASSSLQRHR
jgi:hypothetical protein